MGSDPVVPDRSRSLERKRQGQVVNVSTEPYPVAGWDRQNRQGGKEEAEENLLRVTQKSWKRRRGFIMS